MDYVHVIIEFCIGDRYKPLYCIDSIRKHALDVLVWMKVCRSVHRTLSPVLQDYKRSMSILKKYNTYPVSLSGDPSCLYDLMCTGCDLPFTKNYWDRSGAILYDWTDEMDSDFFFMIQKLPRSLLFDDGTLRCRSKITPLYMSWVNHFVPVSVSSVLLLHAPDLRFNINLNGVLINWEIDLLQNMDSSRKELFRFYFDTMNR